MGRAVRPQMNTENAPKITQPMAKRVVIPNPELTPPPEVPVSDDVFDPVGLGVATVPVYVTRLAVAATCNTEPPPYS